MVAQPCAEAPVLVLVAGGARPGCRQSAAEVPLSTLPALKCSDRGTVTVPLTDCSRPPRDPNRDVLLKKREKKILFKI